MSPREETLKVIMRNDSAVHGIRLLREVVIEAAALLQKSA